MDYLEIIEALHNMQGFFVEICGSQNTQMFAEIDGVIIRNSILGV
jgi:hypothetical protein